MVDEVAASDPASRFSQTLNAAARVPGVRIARDSYLRAALSRHCTDEVVEAAIRTTPARAGVPRDVIELAAKESIRYETAKVTTISAAAGVPGGPALFLTAPADLVQYFAHILRIAQKLAYLNSWPDLFEGDGESLDDATEGILTLFVGIMFGVQAAQVGIGKVSTLIAAQVVKQLPRQALTKGVIYPAVKQVAKLLGVRMTTQIFASGVSKAIPYVGAVLSGGLTFATYMPLAKRLQKHLRSLEMTKPDFGQ